MEMLLEAAHRVYEDNLSYPAEPGKMFERAILA